MDSRMGRGSYPGSDGSMHIDCREMCKTCGSSQWGTGAY